MPDHPALDLVDDLLALPTAPFAEHLPARFVLDRSAGGGEDAGPGRQSQLDGGRADPAGAGVHQEHLAGLEGGPVVQGDV